MDAKSITTTKITDSAMDVTRELVIEIKATTTRYERGFIEKQIESITAQRDEMIAVKQKELDECLTILAEMDKLGIVAAVAAPVDEGLPVETEPEIKLDKP